MALPAPRLPIQIYFRICFNGRMTEEHAYWTDTVPAHRCCNPLGAARRCHYQRLPASIPAPSRRLPHTPPPRCSCLLHIPDLALVARHCLHLGSHSIGRRLKTTSQPLPGVSLASLVSLVASVFAHRHLRRRTFWAWAPAPAPVLSVCCSC